MKRAIVLYIFFLVTLLSSGYGAEGFTINTSTLSDTLSTEESSTSTILVENTNNKTMDFDIITDDAGDITLTPNTISLTINENNSKSISINYTSGNTTGIFNGEIIVLEQQNSSNNETIPLSLNVTSPNQPDISFVDEDSTLRMEGELDDRESSIFTLKNTGNKDLENLVIDMDDLEGDDDRIDENDIEINDEDVDDFELNSFAVDEEENIDIEIDIPSNIDADTYIGDFEILANYDNGQQFSKTFTLEIEVFSDEEDVEFRNLNPLRVTAEEGDSVRNVELLIENNADNDVEDLRLEFDEDFSEQNSDNTMPSSIVEFEDEVFDIGDEDDIEIDMDFIIPENQAQGTYSAELELLNSQGDELDTITIEVRVTGDVFISELDIPETVRPGDNMDVDVTVENQGTKLYRDVKLEAFMFNVNREDNDLDESTSTFLLNPGNEVTKTLRFNIPEDATDGQKTFELKLSYGDTEVTQIESIDIQRPPFKLDMTSHSITPTSISCSNTITSFMDVKNIGKYDDTVTFSTQIRGTDISTQSSSQELDVDQRTSQTQQLDVEDLEPGTYTVVHSAQGELTTSEESTLQVTQCSEGVDINQTPVNTTTPSQNQTETGDTVSFFGEEIDRTTAILSSSLVVITLLIVVSLFFL